MAGGNAIRGTRVGAGPMGESERGETAPREHISYFCCNGHISTPSFAAEADIPEFWDARAVGCPAAGTARTRRLHRAPSRSKTHLAYVKERRSDADGAAILEEALGKCAPPGSSSPSFQ